MAGDGGPMPCLYCRKMCCLNGSRKLHFVQKILLDRIIKYLGPEVFFAHLRNFLQVLDLLIFRQKQPGHWAEVVCHFHLLVSRRKDREYIFLLQILGRKRGGIRVERI